MGQEKNNTQAMAFDLINIDSQKMFKDKKKIKIIFYLKERLVLLGPDKGNRIDIPDKSDYQRSMQELPKDKTKFQIIKQDPTYTRMAMLWYTYQIDKEEYKIIYPKNAKKGRAHGSAKEKAKNVPNMIIFFPWKFPKILP